MAAIQMFAMKKAAPMTTLVSVYIYRRTFFLGGSLSDSRKSQPNASPNEAICALQQSSRCFGGLFPVIRFTHLAWPFSAASVLLYACPWSPPVHT
jgi:hypothetical protein